MDDASSRDVEHVKAGMAGRKSVVGVEEGDRMEKVRRRVRRDVVLVLPDVGKSGWMVILPSRRRGFRAAGYLRCLLLWTADLVLDSCDIS